MAQGTFGNESRFSITVRELQEENSGSRRVDVCAADRWLTCIDNNVYVPHFTGCLQLAVGSLLADPKYARGRLFPELSVADNFRRLQAEEDNATFLSYQFMHWGPTTENVSALLFREGSTAYLAFSFFCRDGQSRENSGQVFVAELPTWELARVLHDAAWALMWDWADRSRWPK